MFSLSIYLSRYISSQKTCFMSIHFLYRHRFTILLSLHHFHLSLSLSILHPPPKSPYMILLLSSLSTFLSSTYPSPLFSSHVTMSKKKIHFLCVSRSFSFYSLFPTLGLQMYFHIFLHYLVDILLLLSITFQILQ